MCRGGIAMKRHMRAVGMLEFVRHVATCQTLFRRLNRRASAVKYSCAAHATCGAQKLYGLIHRARPAGSGSLVDRRCACYLLPVLTNTLTRKQHALVMHGSLPIAACEACRSRASCTC